MSAIRYQGTWQKIQTFYHKQDGAWKAHVSVFAKADADWYAVDLTQEPLDPAYHTWVIYADDPDASVFADKGISLLSTGKQWVGIATGKRKETPVLGVDIKSNADLDDFKWSQLGGETAKFYYISAPQGTAIKNSTGALTLQAHYVEGGNNTVITGAGEPQFYVGNTALGRAPIFTPEDINEAIIVELRDGAQLLDSITLIDVSDGTDATLIGVENSNGTLWSKAPDDGAWSPAATTTQLTFTVYRSGVALFSRFVDVTLDPANGNLYYAILPLASEPEPTLFSVTGEGTPALTITHTHLESGATASEVVHSVKGGSKGSTGSAYRQLTIYRRSTTALTTADIDSTGSFDFDVGFFNPPTLWSSSIPAGTDPVYSATAVAYSPESNGVDNNLSFTEPTLVLQNGGVGQAGLSTYTVNLFQRAATKPAKPTDPATYNFGTNTLTALPADWTREIPDVNGDPLWVTQATFQSPGATGIDSTTAYTNVSQFANEGTDGYSYHTYQVFARSPVQPATPTGGQFDFGNNQATVPTGDVVWSLVPPEGDAPLYASMTTARVQGDTGIDISLSYSTPYVFSINGEAAPLLVIEYSADGATGWTTTFSQGTHFYMRTSADGGNSWSTPSLFVGEDGQNGSYYDYEFAEGTSETTQPIVGWQDAPPTISAGNFLWMRVRFITSTGAQGGWSYSRLTGEKGPQGPQGPIGPAGSAGISNVTWVISGSTWDDNAANAAVTQNGRAKQTYDTVTLTNEVNWSETRYWDGSAWQIITNVFDGASVFNAQAIFNNLAANSINTSFLDVTTLSVEDANWGTTIQISENGVQSGLGYSNYILIDNPAAASTAISARNASTASSRPVIYAATNANSTAGEAIRGEANNGGIAIRGLTQQNGTAVYAYANGASAQNTKAIDVVASAGAKGIHIAQSQPFGHSGNSSIYVSHGSTNYAGIYVSTASFSAGFDTSGQVREQGSRVYSPNNPQTTLNGKTSTTAATANTIVERDSSGDINIPGKYRINGTALSYVSKGTGANQAGNAVHIGWGGASFQRLLLQIDGSDFGMDWPINATYTSDLTQKTVYRREHDTLDAVCNVGAKGCIIYSYHDDPKRKIRLGLGAQDVEPHFPNMVMQPEGPVTHKRMDASATSAPLYVAIKQLNDKLEQLTQRIEALENA